MIALVCSPTQGPSFRPPDDKNFSESDVALMRRGTGGRETGRKGGGKREVDPPDTPPETDDRHLVEITI